MPRNGSDSSALTALRALARRDFLDWRGLAPETSLADVAAVFPVEDDWRGAGHLGEEGREMSWLSVEAEGYPQGLRVWLDQDRVVLIDAESPALSTGLPALLRAIGEPEARWEAYLGTLLIPGSEWVYPGRGLTLHVNPENGILLRLLAYAPTTLEGYRRRLRLDLQRRRRL